MEEESYDPQLALETMKLLMQIQKQLDKSEQQVEKMKKEMRARPKSKNLVLS